MAAADLTAARLRELLHYDQETGVFTWVASCGHRNAGKQVGTVNRTGHVQIAISGVHYYAHRLAFLYMTGAHPSDHVDHINGLPADNRWQNLRAATRHLNMQNRRNPKRHSVSGFLGVCWHAQRKKWLASIFVNGKQRSLGLHATPELAHEAYLKAKRILHPGCTI